MPQSQHAHCVHFVRSLRVLELSFVHVRGKLFKMVESFLKMIHHRPDVVSGG